MKNHVMAIDPGASGGIAYILTTGEIGIFEMPETDADIVAMLRNWSNRVQGHKAVCFLEDLVKHMGEGIPASSMAVYASNWGTIKGAVLALGMRLELVTPQKWQKYLGCGITGRQKAAYFSTMFDYERAAEKKRVALINSQLKRDWKNKLKTTAQSLYPKQADAITLKTADAVLIMEYGRCVNL